jgi:hypothetical protein
MQDFERLVRGGCDDGRHADAEYEHTDHQPEIFDQFRAARDVSAASGQVLDSVPIQMSTRRGSTPKCSAIPYPRRPRTPSPMGLVDHQPRVMSRL